MLVVGCATLKVGDKELSEGNPIPEASEWPEYLKRMYFANGSIREVSEGEAARLYRESQMRDARDKVNLRRRLLAPIEAKVKGFAAKIEEARANLASNEAHLARAYEQHDMAQASVLEAELELQGLAPPPAPVARELPTEDTEKTDEDLQELEPSQADQVRELASALSLPRIRARVREHLGINMPRLTKAAAVEFVVQQVDEKILAGEREAVAALLESMTPEGEGATYPDSVTEKLNQPTDEEGGEGDDGDDGEDPPAADDDF